MPFDVRKGPADPFRGDWYVHENSFDSSTEAVALALMLTQKNYTELTNSWEQFGYEWSVFEVTADEERKIWEGYKAISVMRAEGREVLGVGDGWV